MEIYISKRVQDKLDDKHDGVTMAEIRQCFSNISGKILVDARENHLTNPLTRWFIAQTNCGRKLKIAYIPRMGNIHIKTAYEPNADEINVYAEGNK